MFWGDIAHHGEEVVGQNLKLIHHILIQEAKSDESWCSAPFFFACSLET